MPLIRNSAIGGCLSVLLLTGGCAKRVDEIPLEPPADDVNLEVHARGFLDESFVGWGDDELARGGRIHLRLEDPAQVRRLLQALPVVCRDPQAVPEHPDLIVLVRYRNGREITRIDRYSRFEYLPGNAAFACSLVESDRAAISEAVLELSRSRD